MPLLEGMDVVHNISLAALITIGFSLFFRIFQWIRRILTIGKSMPIVPVLFPSTSKFRVFIPKSWQMYHRDWHMQYGRSIYQKHGCDVFALISLFEHDMIFIADPHAVLEMKVTGADRFQNDSYQTSQVVSIFYWGLQEIAIYGPNVVSTVGTEWKFHRKIVVRGFPQKTIELVHSETTRQVIQMMASWEKNVSDNCVSVEKFASMSIALLTKFTQAHYEIGAPCYQWCCIWPSIRMGSIWQRLSRS